MVGGSTVPFLVRVLLSKLQARSSRAPEQPTHSIDSYLPRVLVTRNNGQPLICSDYLIVMLLLTYKAVLISSGLRCGSLYSSFGTSSFALQRLSVLGSFIALAMRMRRDLSAECEILVAQDALAMLAEQLIRRIYKNTSHNQVVRSVHPSTIGPIGIIIHRQT